MADRMRGLAYVPAGDVAVFVGGEEFGFGDGAYGGEEPAFAGGIDARKAGMSGRGSMAEVDEEGGLRIGVGVYNRVGRVGMKAEFTHRNEREVGFERDIERVDARRKSLEGQR